MSSNIKDAISDGYIRKWDVFIINVEWNHIAILVEKDQPLAMILEMHVDIGKGWWVILEQRTTLTRITGDSATSRIVGCGTIGILLFSGKYYCKESLRRPTIDKSFAYVFCWFITDLSLDLSLYLILIKWSYWRMSIHWKMTISRYIF